MRFAIITSKRDIAGMNIRENLLDMFDFSESGDFKGNAVYQLDNVRLYAIDGPAITFESVDEDIEADYYIFATRHQSKSGEKTLSIHFPGNFSEASGYGGRDNELCMAPAKLLKEGYKLLCKSEDIGYSITLEATHHGPFLDKAVLFIEIGSQEEQWADKNAGKIIAQIIIDMIKNYDADKKYEIAIGFGGTHYCHSFNKIEENTDIAISHICPKYYLDGLDEVLVKRMVDSTHEKVDFALIDWKGMSGEQKNNLIAVLDKLDIEWKKTKGLGSE